MKPYRSLSRSVNKVPNVSNNGINNDLIKPISPLLVDSIKYRLSNLKVEVDLGIGPIIEECNDVLEESIIKTITIEQLKSIITINYRNMNARHVSQCFQTINNIIKYSDNFDELCCELMNSKEVKNCYFEKSALFIINLCDIVSFIGK